MKTTPCRGCGKPIVFVLVPHDDGKVVRVPLDLRAPVYTVTVWDQDGTPSEAVRLWIGGVSHFSTCPKAADFSAAKRNAKVKP